MTGTRAVLVAAVLAAPAAPASARDEVIHVFEAARIEFDPGLDDVPRDGYRLLDSGRAVERTVELPPAPADQRDARRIIATITVRSVPVAGGTRPGDVWTRLGSVGVVAGPGAPGAPRVVELLRFATGFGAGGTFSADVTALAPLLHGRRGVRVFISTFRKPAWEVDLRLAYLDRGAGYRRPVFAAPLFNEPAVTAERPRLRAEVTVPEGLAPPRARIISTGHSTEGGPFNEFVSATHVLRIDGREVARWRPWAESGVALRDRNPWAGRETIDGREVWSSDFDRSGWHPGALVEPLVLPLPELTPGRHEVELEIIGILPPGEEHGHGYWRVSGVVVADEPWPAE